MVATEDWVCSVPACTNPFWFLKKLIPGSAPDLMDEYFLVRVFPGKDFALLVTQKREDGFRDYMRMGGLLLTSGYNALVVFI